MLNQPTQQLILPRTAHLRTAIHRLLMHGALDMLIQPRQRREAPRAEIAPVRNAVPRACRGHRLHAVVALHRQHRPRDDVLVVEAAHELVDARAGQAGRAGPGLEVDGGGGGGGEGALAEGAFHIGALVGARVHVLHEVVLVAEDAVAGCAVGMEIGVVEVAGALTCEAVSADIALPAVGYHVGDTVIDVLVVAVHGVEPAVAGVTVRHCEFLGGRGA